MELAAQVLTRKTYLYVCTAARGGGEREREWVLFLLIVLRASANRAQDELGDLTAELLLFYKVPRGYFLRDE